MLMRLGQLRRLVREVLRESSAGIGVTSSPVAPDGAYPYDIDIFGHGILTPGESIDFHSFRPDDPKLALGMKRDAATNANAVHPVSLGLVGVAARGDSAQPTGTDDLDTDPQGDLEEETPEI
jgi:hypothetical protein